MILIYPQVYNKIIRYLEKIIPYEVKFEHVGSTAVVGLGGREIIDILVLVEKNLMQNLVDLLVSNGFKYNSLASIPPKKLFVSGFFEYKNRSFHVHIHITFAGSNEHLSKILFRDYLRKHPDEAKIYDDLKRRWMAKSRADRFKYSLSKTSYIKEVLRNNGYSSVFI